MSLNPNRQMESFCRASIRSVMASLLGYHSPLTLSEMLVAAVGSSSRWLTPVVVFFSGDSQRLHPFSRSPGVRAGGRQHRPGPCHADGHRSAAAGRTHAEERSGGGRGGGGTPAGTGNTEEQDRLRELDNIQATWHIKEIRSFWIT